MELAAIIATWSKDPSTKVGCVIVGVDNEIRSTGFNGFPRGIRDDERLSDRDTKLAMICHAEENAIMHAARVGVPLKGTVAYVTFPPCSRCARSLVQAGVSRVVCPGLHTVPERWASDVGAGADLMVESGMTVEYTSISSLAPEDHFPVCQVAAP